MANKIDINFQTLKTSTPDFTQPERAGTLQGRTVVRTETAGSKTDKDIGTLRNVKAKDLCKELREAGFALKRSTGGHHQYVHHQAKGIGVATLPVNSKNSLSPGVVKSVRAQIKRAKEHSEDPPINLP